MPYIQGFLLAVPVANKDAYRKMAREFWEVARDHGCLAVRETWGVDVPDGKVTSFPMAVKLKADEAVVFSWTEWTDRAACDRGMEAVMKDGRLSGMEMSKAPFDGQRMMWGGFEELLAERAAVPA